MSPEQQRIAIAEACGWKSIGEQYWLKVDVTSGGKQYASHITHLPDYLTDLNAMHEAEKVLDEKQQNKYQIGLANLVAKSPFNTYGHWSDVGSVFTVHATARQRAEAFLRTIGKWKE